jgi:hypothetical protein
LNLCSKRANLFGIFLAVVSAEQELSAREKHGAYISLCSATIASVKGVKRYSF